MQYTKYIIFNIFLIFFLILLVVSYLLGAKPLIVTSNSMSPSINEGDLVIVLKSKQYEINDVISFENKGEIVTHRVISRNNEQLETKGDANKSLDLSMVFTKNILGKVKFTIPFLGFLFMYLQSKYFFYFVLFLSIILLLRKIKNVKK